ncbi:hypothetical protein BN2475_60003 [Paraburkholderia ribeironis]|uniref:Uncharacterized protein n=1 Tax=Paraburkholderia ribeironis TaxID=1247936 RepID=A0A1N7RLD7_9BURK|nr:hypothetical protein BN2475_60003 [Paraburkholderia ribeironis]
MCIADRLTATKPEDCPTERLGRRACAQTRAAPIPQGWPAALRLIGNKLPADGREYSLGRFQFLVIGKGRTGALPFWSTPRLRRGNTGGP